MINDEQAVVLTSGRQRIATEVKNKKTGDSLRKRETVLDSKQQPQSRVHKIVKTRRIFEVTNHLSFFQGVIVHKAKPFIRLGKL